MKIARSDITVHAAYEVEPVPIVSDAAIIRRGFAGGRMIPLLILDTSNRPDIKEFIRVHQAFGPGDVKVQWGQLPGREGTVALFLEFVRPSELTVVLEFDIAKQGILVEQALFGQGLYLQSGRAGDRLIHDPNRPKVLVEVGDTGFRDFWERLFHKHLEKHFRANGMRRSESRRAARSAIAEMRKIGAVRLRDVAE